MRKLRLLVLTLLVATSSFANTRNWKPAKVDITSETDVSSKMWGEKNTLHYTIETDDMIYFVDYSFKPGQHSNSHPPEIGVEALTKVAIEGRHVYVLDATGKEIKMHIAKRTAKL